MTLPRTVSQIGLKTNRRLPDVQRLSHDPILGEDEFEKIHRPTVVHNQRASALRLDDIRVRALFAALLLLHFLPRGFTNHELRKQMALLLGLRRGQFTQGRMTYDLRRLRLHGLIEPIPKSRRYHVTSYGYRSATFLLRAYNRVLRPGLAQVAGPDPQQSARLRTAIRNVERAIDALWLDAA
jgi:hypothetical protein